jgi:hypothetical protein
MEGRSIDRLPPKLGASFHDDAIATIFARGFAAAQRTFAGTQR